MLVFFYVLMVVAAVACVVISAYAWLEHQRHLKFLGQHEQVTLAELFYRGKHERGDQ